MTGWDLNNKSRLNHCTSMPKLHNAVCYAKQKVSNFNYTTDFIQINQIKQQKHYCGIYLYLDFLKMRGTSIFSS